MRFGWQHTPRAATAITFNNNTGTHSLHIEGIIIHKGEMRKEGARGERTGVVTRGGSTAEFRAGGVKGIAAAQS